MTGPAVRTSSDGVILRSRTDLWLTPPALLAALGPFDLDPCAASEPRPWPTAARHIARPADGLTAAWAGRTWLNPPYSAHHAHYDCDPNYGEPFSALIRAEPAAQGAHPQRIVICGCTQVPELGPRPHNRQAAP